MTNALDDVNNLLMNAGKGTKPFSWSDYQIGAIFRGTILDLKKSQMTKYQSKDLDYWPSGDPKMQIVATMQTEYRDPSNAEDDGRRLFYIEPRMMVPLREALERVGATGLAIGGKVAFQWTSGSGLGEGNARQFAAEYANPVVEIGSMLAPGNATQATPAAAAAPMLSTPAPTQPAAPAAAPAATPAAAPQGGILGSMLAAPATGADEPAPPGIDPEKWKVASLEQRQAVKAAMGIPF